MLFIFSIERFLSIEVIIKKLMESKRIVILGVGNILLKDEGVGVRVIEKLGEHYFFPDNVELVDGGTLGLQLLGTVAEADYLIVVDAVKNGKLPGTLYRFETEDIPHRVAYKNSLHQVDLLESLTLSQALGNTPETVILGVEPEDISPWGTELTPAVQGKVPELMKLVLKELDRLNIKYTLMEET
ncbi:MAG: HyaD/HybD family hydrogenase maturation endopeptidase [Pseudomonadota bacterium]